VAFLVGFSAWVALLAAIHGGKGEPPGGWHWGD
jgi:hypothetical protein